MPNETGGAKTICPFYLGEEKLSLRCEGFIGVRSSRIAFRCTAHKVAWQEGKCFSYAYGTCCPLAKAIYTYNHDTPREKR